jgi:carboxyl-terminal processing protease
MSPFSVPARLAIIAALVAAFCATTAPQANHVYHSTLVGLSQPGERGDSLFYDAALQPVAEAIAQIERKAVFLKPGSGDRQGTMAQTLNGFLHRGSDGPESVAEALNAFLATQDPYSVFLTRDEYEKFREIGERSYAGIGLEIEKRRDGEIISYPIIGGPAANAGIRAGDRLVAINGTATRGKSLPFLATLATGRPGTRVAVDIVTTTGATKHLTITRAEINTETISEYTQEGMRVIRLSLFTPSTRPELDYLLTNWRRTDPIIIDLRGCGGGDFHAAVDAAMLFLQKGQTIASLQERAGVHSYTSTISRQLPSQPVYLWQDGATASAAEIFIAALTENGRATSLGKTSAGKGTKQDIIELSGGAALFLTTGYLLTPRGRMFDGRGIEPMHAVDGDSADTNDYLDKVRALVRRREAEDPTAAGRTSANPVAR